MEFTVFRDQENAGNVLRNKENNLPRDRLTKRRSVLGVLNSKQPFNKQEQQSKLKTQGTNTFCFPTKSSIPFTIHEDDAVDFKKADEKLFDKNVENTKPAVLKNESKISESEVIVPNISAKERKPLSDLCQVNQSPVKAVGESADKSSVVDDDDESLETSRVYWPMFDHDKSMTAHRLSCNIDTYTCELYFYLRAVEKSHRPKPGYMRRQPDVTYSMRAILVDWLVEVAQEYKLQNETLYLAVSFIDRFLSLMSVVRAKLQLLGTAAMFVASKYEEIYPPDVSEFVYITDDTYTKKQVLKMEQLILKVLGFDVSNPTTIIFLSHICVHCNVSLKVMYLAMYLGELSLLEADPYLSFVPSMIGCGAVALARLILEYEDIWPKEMSDLTNYCLNDLIPILKHLNQTYKGALHIQQNAIRLKYKSTRYHCVSDIEYKDLIVPEETTQKEMSERLKLVDVQDKS
ncbi:cyclin-A2 [Sipha flava]|uniref:Cyclin-A2 n=1 Tax=Sipha flava TaxID=143950 RepID=A0A2S2QM37_9HEMI|nr:cyclin-A2 [Sipha flava]XP_025415049.1 cyclin-A2 [Sipha flava]